jgi:hypothetical protein
VRVGVIAGCDARCCVPRVGGAGAGTVSARWTWGLAKSCGMLPEEITVS